MAVPKRFAVVRFFGTFMKVIAWIVLVVSILGAIGVALLGSTSLVGNFAADFMPFLQDMAAMSVGTSMGIMAGIGLVVAGIFNFLIFYMIGEMIHMQLAVEENTRLTAALLLRMHQDSRIQEEQAAYGDSGFVSEAYE